MIKIEISPRYGVAGVYVDRGRRTVRVYPFPFIRVSLGAA